MSTYTIGHKYTFAEYFTTLATILTVFNVYTSASVSSPPAGLSGLSFRSQRQFGKRTITSSSRLYLTMAVPYIAATVLVQNIATEEVAPIFIAAVASISGRFNKGRHTFVEWVFKSLRTFICMSVLSCFMIFFGLSGEVIDPNEKNATNLLEPLFRKRLWPHHALLAPFTSFRWFALLFMGFLTVPEKQKRAAVILAVLKIALVWLLIEGTSTFRTNDEWSAFDAVIVTRTPLRYTVFILYSVLIALDAAEIVTAAIVAERRAKVDMEDASDDSVGGGAVVVAAPSEYSESDDDIPVGAFPPVDSLRRRPISRTDDLLTWEDFFDAFCKRLRHFLHMSAARLRKAPSDSDLDIEMGREAPPVVSAKISDPSTIDENEDDDDDKDDQLDEDTGHPVLRTDVVGINIRPNNNKS